jgi:uncharacterized protein YodC (DUF2158 family)
VNNPLVRGYLPGDVVRERGDVTRMTIDVVKPGRVQCVWFDAEQDFNRKEFDIKDIELATDDIGEDDWYPEEDWYEDDFEEEDDEFYEEDEDDVDVEGETPVAGIAVTPA